MKKCVCFLLAICFALTACGGDPIDTGKNPPSGGSGENPCDYTIAVDSGEAINILQITDPQITEGGTEQLNSKCFKYIDYAIEESQPDLIIVTGDIIYGRYDQNGALLSALIDYFEEKEIPWAPVFGNHDNESAKGTDWQCEQFEEAEHCYFVRRENLGNNGSYSIGFTVGGTLVRVLYMLDAGGCTMIDGTDRSAPMALTDAQLNWLKETQESAAKFAGNTVSGFVAMHYMPSFIATSVMTKYKENITQLREYAIPENQDGDFGGFGGKFSRTFDRDQSYYNFLTENGIDGIFAGHEHLNDASVFYEGVRLTYGLKSSEYDSFRFDKLGGTLITLEGTAYSVGHIYYPVSV